MASLFRIALLAFVVLFGFGCSTFAIQKDRMSAVKKVAIIGFSVEQERTSELKISWTSGGEGWKAGAQEKTAAGDDRYARGPKKGTVWNTAEASHIGGVYRALGKQLEKELGMQVADPERLLNNHAYSEMAAKERMTARWIPMNPQPMDFFSLPGIASPEKANRFSKEEREQLQRELGVDALAVAVVRIHFERNDNLVIGKFSAGSYVPSVQTTFSLYDAKDDEAIWKDFMVAGERGKGQFQASGITNEELLYKKAVNASELSFHQLIERYRAEVASSR
ncbi:MAG: hypothetical protein HY075_06385 [Deltaproteobacteria bacterium]|nr:hypothetical protein [Deltaproteobacteria bacterium]